MTISWVKKPEHEPPIAVFRADSIAYSQGSATGHFATFDHSNCPPRSSHRGNRDPLLHFPAYDILYCKMSNKEEATREDSKRSQLYKGIAEVVLLSLLKDGARYGLEILDQLRSIARLSLADGTIYPLLYRLERAGFVASEWHFDTKGVRPRKYYKLTKRGNAELKVLLVEWHELSSNVDSFLNRQ